MDTVFAIVLWGHIVVAFTGLATFWVPVAARKGGHLHRALGKVFAGCAYLVNGSALVITLLRVAQMFSGQTSLSADPEGGGLTIFLGYLAIVTLTCIRHAVLMIETRGYVDGKRAPFHRFLAVGSMLGSVLIAAVAVLFWSRLSVLFLLLSPVGFLLGAHVLRTMRKPPTQARAWLQEHMNAMLGAGVAFHTAFAVFGLGRLFGLAPQGTWWFLPWILPGIIGVPIMVALNIAYRHRGGG